MHVNDLVSHDLGHVIDPKWVRIFVQTVIRTHDFPTQTSYLFFFFGIIGRAVVYPECLITTLLSKNEDKI